MPSSSSIFNPHIDLQTLNSFSTTKPTKNPTTNTTTTTMHLTPTFLLPLLLPLTSAVTLSYDNGYSDRSRPLTAVSCSDGSNGLITRYGWKTQGEIPRFPYIGGSSDIAGWNSPSCGQCYQVEYAKTGKKVFVLAIDHVAQGLNVAQKAMDELTNNQAVSLSFCFGSFCLGGRLGLIFDVLV